MASLPRTMRCLVRPSFLGLVLASMVSTSRAEVCEACRVESSKTILCDPHSKAQAAVLGAPVSGQPDERIAKLQEIARLARAHENAPSPNAARAIAKSLKDADDKVRAEAAQLLSPEQHRRISRQALSDALRQQFKVLEVKHKGLNKFHLEQLPPLGDKRLGAVAKKNMEELERFKTLRNELVEEQHRLSVLAGALARHPCQDTLRDLTNALDEVVREEPYVQDGLCVAILSVDDVDAAAEVIRAIAAWEPRIARLDEKPFKEGHEKLRKVHDALVQYAAAHHIADVPPWSRFVSKDWTSWLTRNRGALSKPLPACDSLGPAN